MIKNILYDTNVMQYKFWEFYVVKEFNIIDKTLLFFMITFYIFECFFVTLYNILQYYKNTFQINAVLSNILELYTKNPEKEFPQKKNIYIYILSNITVFNIDNSNNIFLGNKSTCWNDFWRIVWNWKTITGINDPLKHIKVENSYCKW